MPVPDTTTFTFQNVIDTVNPTTDDLVDCFADADAGKFDSNYEGSKNQLLNFRNYGAFTAFGSSVTATSSRLVCATSIGVTRYHNGSGEFPAVGDNVWNTSSGTGDPGDGWYRNEGNTTYFLTSTVVTSVAIC